MCVEITRVRELFAFARLGVSVCVCAYHWGKYRVIRLLGWRPFRGRGTNDRTNLGGAQSPCTGGWCVCVCDSGRNTVAHSSYDVDIVVLYELHTVIG